MKRLLEARMRDRDRMRSWTQRTQRDRAEGSLTPARTGSHGDHMPETVSLGVLSEFTSPHTQDEDNPHKEQARAGPQSARSKPHRDVSTLGMVTPDTGSCAHPGRAPSPTGTVIYTACGGVVSHTGRRFNWGTSTRTETERGYLNHEDTVPRKAGSHTLRQCHTEAQSARMQPQRETRTGTWSHPHENTAYHTRTVSRGCREVALVTHGSALYKG